LRGTIAITVVGVVRSVEPIADTDQPVLGIVGVSFYPVAGQIAIGIVGVCDIVRVAASPIPTLIQAGDLVGAVVDEIHRLDLRSGLIPAGEGQQVARAVIGVVESLSQARGRPRVPIRAGVGQPLQVVVGVVPVVGGRHCGWRCRCRRDSWRAGRSRCGGLGGRCRRGWCGCCRRGGRRGSGWCWRGGTAGLADLDHKGIAVSGVQSEIVGSRRGREVARQGLAGDENAAVPIRADRIAEVLLAATQVGGVDQRASRSLQFGHEGIGTGCCTAAIRTLGLLDGVHRREIGRHSVAGHQKIDTTLSYSRLYDGT
jgi:hypothetical protein